MAKSARDSGAGISCKKVGDLLEFGLTPHHQIEEMDRDHREIVDSLRQMQDLVIRNSSDVHLYQSHAAHLLETICGHFYREAKAMSQASYGKIGEHLRAHAVLCGQVHDAVEGCTLDGPAALSAIPTMVMSWLNSHIVIDDQDYARHVQSQSVDSRPSMQMTVEAEKTHFACDETCRKKSANCAKKH